MTSMPVYHISKKYIGKEVLLEPRVPDLGMIGEDNATPRICVSTSVLGCLYSLELINVA